MKTARNCLASNKRKMWVSLLTSYRWCSNIAVVTNYNVLSQCMGKDVSWCHIVNLYYNNSGTGLSVIPKLKYEHIFLTSFSKMRVDLAAQVRGTHNAHKDKLLFYMSWAPLYQKPYFCREGVMQLRQQNFLTWWTSFLTVSMLLIPIQGHTNGINICIHGRRMTFG